MVRRASVCCSSNGPSGGRRVRLARGRRGGEGTFRVSSFGFSSVIAEFFEILQSRNLETAFDEFSADFGQRGEFVFAEFGNAAGEVVNGFEGSHRSVRAVALWPLLRAGRGRSAGPCAGQWFARRADFSPLRGLVLHYSCFPTAYAVGCILFAAPRLSHFWDAWPAEYSAAVCSDWTPWRSRTVATRSTRDCALRTRD